MTHVATHIPASRAVKQSVADLDQLRADTNSFFECLATDLTANYEALSDRLRQLEEALLHKSAGAKEVALPEVAPPSTKALQAVQKLRDGNGPGFNLEALLDEVDAEHEVVQETERRRREAAVLVGVGSVPGTPGAGQGQHGTSTPGSAPYTNGSSDSASASTLAMMAANGAATPVQARRSAKASVQSSPAAARVLTPAADGSALRTPVADVGKATFAYAESHRPVPQHLAFDYPKNINVNQPTSVLVEFKRQRVLQFESDFYVAPGEHVVVGGDRGEDIGLVTYSWPTNSTQAPPTPAKAKEMGVGRVQRVASNMEISQLQGVQAELEKRAKEVATQKVQEHGLPMMIVDAEYQFDRKKLTFYYQSQHRLDFRVLVRDLYKTFRARIWMELV
jgi:hypothetical protein